MDYPEELLHFIWRNRLYNQDNLKTTEGEALKIINVGRHNSDAGPDFEFATIQLGKVRWTGHIEIHVREDSWLRHGHHLDPRYSATILHVVWDRGVLSNIRYDGTSIPTFVLSDYVDPQLLARYDYLRKQSREIACEGQLKEVVPFVRPGWLERLAIERLEEKYHRCHDWLTSTKQDWERVLLITLGRAMGTNINGVAFEELMGRIEPKLLYKYNTDPEKIAAILFGNAGFLNVDPTDDYFALLKQEYYILQRLYSLECMSPTHWKFMRTRPYNFPTYRLAQLSAMICLTGHWFEKIRSIAELQELFELIRSAKVDEYWRTHFRFGIPTKQHSTKWSNTFLYNLAINCFIPVLFSYGQFVSDEQLKYRALSWLEQIPAEENAVIRYYKHHGISCMSAMDSQALLLLRNNYCSQKKCLDCAIGSAILNL